MVNPRRIHLGVLILLVAQSCIGEGNEDKSKENGNGVSGDTLLKKQGLAAPDIPDQIAIETGIHEQVEALPGYGNFPPVPVPVPIKGYPGSIVLPLPPQGDSNLGGGHGGPPKKEYGGPQLQGQYSQPQHLRQPPPTNFQAFHNNGPQPQQGNGGHGGFQQDQKFNIPREPELLIAAPNQPGQHQHHSGEQQRYNNQFQPPQQHQRPPGAFGHPFRGDQGPPKPSQYNGPQESSVQSILKEFLKNQAGPKPGPPHHHQQSHRYPGPPPPPLAPQQSFFGPPKPNGPPQPPHHQQQQQQQQYPHQGKPFQASKEVNNELQAEGGEFPVVQYGGVLGSNPAGPWSDGPESADMAKIVTLEVKCEKNAMRIFIAFDRPFYGVIFSKGHYHNVHCIHLPAGLGHQSANFDIGIDSCGTQASSDSSVAQYGAPPQSGSGSFFENVIVIQYDSQVQEVWDQARKLRCTWHDQYEKSVTFRPFPVDMLEVVRADFAGDNVGCWMQIQVGKGPWASEVSGLVKIGQTMTMVLAIKDDENKFDMLVRNCLAHDGHRSPIQLVDQFGCIVRPKLMSKFTKIKNFGASASVLSYAHFQAFKFPDSMEVHFQCTIQICRYQCPEQCTQQGGADAGAGGYGGVGKSGLPAEGEQAVPGSVASASRRRRSASHNETGTGDLIDLGDDEVYEYTTTFKITPQGDDKENVGLNRVITVVSNDDLESLKNAAFGGKLGAEEEEGVKVIEAYRSEIVCMSTVGFAAMLVILIGCFLVACIVASVLIIKKPRKY